MARPWNWFGLWAEVNCVDKLIIASREFDSRLLVGTGKFASCALMAEAIESSGTEIVTVALRWVFSDN